MRSSQLQRDMHVLRGEIQSLVNEFNEFRKLPVEQESVRADELDVGEVKANLTLAMRHLEDARMRCGKVIQALEGGVSCYDKGKK